MASHRHPLLLTLLSAALLLALVLSAIVVLRPSPAAASGPAIASASFEDVSGGGADYGDAPDSYGTLAGSSGPSHPGIPGIYSLGAALDVEPDGQPSPLADGDDMNLVYAGVPDDEDGVTLLTPLIPGMSASAVVTLTNLASFPAFLDAWIDFDASGTFEEPAERLAPPAFLAPGPNILSFPVPPGATLGLTYARLRLSFFGGLPPTGPDPNPGEVEDYLVLIGTGATATPTNTPVPPTPTNTPTNTPVPPTPTNTPTNTPVPPTPTNTPTNTPIPPTPTNTPTNTPVPPTPTNTPTNTPVPPTPTNTPVPPTPTNTPTPIATPLPLMTAYVSADLPGTTGNGIPFEDEDILAYDGAGTWSMYFDGSDVGLCCGPERDIDAFHILPDGSLILSTAGPTALPGIGFIDDSDLLRFIPTSTGSSTSGTWELYFDGSDVGLTTDGEDIDAVHVLSNGRILLSTSGSVSVPGASGQNADLLTFIPSSLGASTAGIWVFGFDGSDVGLTSPKHENINGIWAETTMAELYLTTTGDFVVTGASGDGNDVFICDVISAGMSTACSFAFFWDALGDGFGAKRIDALFIDP